MIKHGRELFSKICDGASILADAVGSTMGPRGRSVIIPDERGGYRITKDGVTVAGYVHSEDPVENIGIRLVREAAQGTVKEAGDGTTTSTVLAAAILTAARDYPGAAPIEIKRGMDAARDLLVENLEKASRPISSVADIEHIATISANGDEMLGKMVAKAVLAAGKDGAIKVDRVVGSEPSLEMLEGFRLPSGYAAKAFVNKNGAVEYKSGVLVAVTDEIVETVEQIIGILGHAAAAERPLVIVAKSVESAALASAVANSRNKMANGRIELCVVKAPFFGSEAYDVLEDLAVATGATLYSKRLNKDLREFSVEDFGVVDKFQASAVHSLFLGGAGDEDLVKAQIEEIKVRMDVETDEYKLNALQQRISRLSAAACVIRAGASTPAETNEMADRLDDALEAVRVAEQGMLPGGGTALAYASQGLPDLAAEYMKNDLPGRAIGVKILQQACREPLCRIVQNAGRSSGVFLKRTLDGDGSVGPNMATGEMEDMFEAGVVDPFVVTTSALKNAVSISSTLLTTDYAILPSDS